ncbi:MAG: adenylate/guanylate cyclase domain-containing protein [Nocardioides sp.]|uniref:adenylate/guanylate cyclase domain-containing protein n=1 Tax=Nocardioides sp. TaxID=35761 RepID=UPI0039E2EFFC
MAEAAAVPAAVAVELWRLLGFPHAEPDEVAFTTSDVEALRLAGELQRLGVLSPDRQAALVRTWGRSFARLAEWQTSLLADVAREHGDDDVMALVSLADQVLPRVESLQSYVWRRHLASAAGRVLAVGGATAVPLGIGFVDIVGYTSRSKSLTETELVGWVEAFESVCAGVVVDHGGRVIKNLGDAVLYAVDDVRAAVDIALDLVGRGEDADGEPDFPEVRAGVGYGEVVSRLGDVFGASVNIASRLTSLAKPGTVLIDQGAADALAESEDLRIDRLRRTSVKGYSRLQPYRVRPVG